jgi:hypothetical protein
VEALNYSNTAAELLFCNRSGSLPQSTATYVNSITSFEHPPPTPHHTKNPTITTDIPKLLILKFLQTNKIGNISYTLHYIFSDMFCSEQHIMWGVEGERW